MKKAKNPYVYTPEGHKVFTIMCPKTKRTFEHTQIGKGRPPVYHPDIRKPSRVRK